MPAPYNLTGVAGETNLYGFLTKTNLLVDGFFGIGIILVSYIILFVAFKRFSSKQAFGAASFIVALFATILRVLTWVSDEIMFGTFIIAGIALIWLRWSD